MTDAILLEEFHDAEKKVGALIRRFEGSVLHSIMTARFGDHLVRLVQHTEFAGSTSTAWRSFIYEDGDETTCATCAADGTVTVSGRAAPELEQAVPSYAAVRILLEFLDGDAQEVVYGEFLEGELQPYEARLVRLGEETVGTPTGLAEATRVELHRGGVLASTFWARDGRVVASDWNGARSYPVPDRDTLVEGLHPDVVLTIDDFLAG